MARILPVFAIFFAVPVVHGSQHSVTGKSLAKCDRSKIDDPRYPTTGYMRGVEELSDRCAATHHDAGSHFVCMDLPYAVVTLSSGETVPYSPFWTKTGQARSAEQASTWPRPGPWCICMWAFSRMLQQHPEFINDLDCDATNAWTLDLYNIDNPPDRQALLAICRKCDSGHPNCQLARSREAAGPGYVVRATSENQSNQA